MYYNTRCLTEFTCGDGTCIDLKVRCDGKSDCLDKSDEENCSPCRPNETACHNGQCIKLTALCNGEIDCANGEDEKFEYCLTRKCPDQFICQITRDQCVEKPCGLVAHCRDHSDRAPEVCAYIARMQTNQTRCGDNQFTCRNGNQCINSFFHCDKHVDCEDGSDEVNCAHTPDTLHNSDEFVCIGGLSIPRMWVCDEKKDCPNGDDELIGSESMSNCPQPTTSLVEKHHSVPSAACPPNSSRCGATSTMSTPKCLHQNQLCDGIYDCEDYSDELEPLCGDSCSAKNQFACHTAPDTATNGSTPYCIPRHKVCDGSPDCPRGDDEHEGPRTNCTIPNCSWHNGGCSQVCEMVDDSVKCSCFDGYMPPVDSRRSCVAIGDISVLYVESGQLLQRRLSQPKEPHQLLRIIDNVASKNLTDYKPTLQWIRTTTTEADRLHPSSVDLLTVLTSWSGMSDFDYDFVRTSSSRWPHQPDIIFSHSGIWSGLFFTTRQVNKQNSSQVSQHLEDLSAVVHEPDPAQLQYHTAAIAPLLMSFDWVHRLVYWSNGNSGTIHVSSVQEPRWNRTLLQLPSDSQPLGIAVDPRFARLYFIDRGHQPAILVMDMDGQNRERLVTENLTSPYGLSIDFITDELYWADGRRGAIEAFDLRNRKRRVVLQSSEFYPVRVAVFEDWVYWTDRKVNALLRAKKLTGSEIQHLFNLRSPFSFHLQHELLRPAWVSRCRNHECQQLCLPVPLRSYPNYSVPYRCACADGWTVDTENRQICHQVIASRITSKPVSSGTTDSYWIQRAVVVHRLMAAAGISSPESATVSRFTWLLFPLLFGILVSLTLFGLSVTLLMHYRYQKHVYKSVTNSAYSGRPQNDTEHQSADPLLTPVPVTVDTPGSEGDQHLAHEVTDESTRSIKFQLGGSKEILEASPDG